MLRRSPSPTALFTANNRLTLGALLATRALPTPPLIAGFDDLEYAEPLDRPILLTRYDVAEVGRNAGQLLLNSRDRSPATPPHTIPRGGPGDPGPHLSRTPPSRQELITLIEPTVPPTQPAR